MVQDYLMYRTVYKLMLLMLLGNSPVVSAEPDVDDYDYIVREVFWKQLYEGGGWTLYCGLRFDMEGRSQEGYAIGIDQVYATEWMLDHLQCRNRNECTATSQDFRVMESDMHNLYPIWSDLVLSRNGRGFGNVKGDESRFDDCHFEWDARNIEPRDLSKGNVARSILYMHRQYKLPLSAEKMKLMQEWNRADPPSEQERVRNDRIEQIQGKRNPYIDNPALADRPGPVRGR